MRPNTTEEKKSEWIKKWHSYALRRVLAYRFSVLCRPISLLHYLYIAYNRTFYLLFAANKKSETIFRRLGFITVKNAFNIQYYFPAHRSGIYEFLIYQKKIR